MTAPEKTRWDRWKKAIFRMVRVVVLVVAVYATALLVSWLLDHDRDITQVGVGSLAILLAYRVMKLEDAAEGGKQ